MTDVRHRYDAYREAVEREVYHFRSGQKSTLELDEVDARFGDVTSGDLLDEIDAEKATGFTEEARASAGRLALGIRAAVVEQQCRPLSCQISERDAAEVLRIDREEKSLYAWQASIGSEAEADRRDRIRQAVESAWDERNPLREELWMRRAGALARLGFETPRAWAEAWHPELDYPTWREHAGFILEKTEGIYRDRIGRGLSRLGVEATHSHWGDTACLFRMKPFDRWFPPSRLQEALGFTLEEMGIRLGNLSGVTLDLEARSGKHPRASCVAPRIPGEVYVLAYPRGGLPDYESLFHEVGHALHFAFTSSALSVERRRLYDPALTETWAFLIHYRLGDPEWLAQSPAAERGAQLVPALALHKLFLVRRYAAKLRFELELAAVPSSESPRVLAGRYAEELSHGTGLRYRGVGYLVDTDPDLYCADYLRAWCLEARLTGWLRERFGRRFWRARRAGDLLKELWNTGGSYTADALAQELGLGAIDPEALVDELVESE